MKNFFYFNTLKQVNRYLKDTGNLEFIKQLYNEITQELSSPVFVLNHPENRIQYEEMAKAYADILGLNYFKCFCDKTLI